MRVLLLAMSRGREGQGRLSAVRCEGFRGCQCIDDAAQREDVVRVRVRASVS